MNPSGTAKTLGSYVDIASLGAIPAARSLGSKIYTSDTAYKLLTKGILDESKKKALTKTLGGFSAGMANTSN